MEIATVQMAAVFALIVASLVLYASEKLPLEVTSLGVLCALMVLFQVLPVAGAQGEMVGTTLQFLSTELVRLREERKIQAMAMLAERTRRLREAEEGGKRAKELDARTKEDERFRAVMRVRAGTVDKYLSEVINDTAERVAE